MAEDFDEKFPCEGSLGVTLAYFKKYNINLKSLYGGKTNIHTELISKKRLDIIEVLLKEGLNINLKNKEGYTMIHRACTSKSLKSVTFLFERGADISIKINGDTTLLMTACSVRSPEIVNFLLEKGLNPNEIDSVGSNCLHHAVSSNSIEVIELLLKAGMDINHPMRGETPLYMACKSGSLDMVTFILENGGDYEVEYNGLPEEGPLRYDPRFSDHNGKTPLSIACEKQRHNVVRILLNYGAREKIDLEKVTGEINKVFEEHEIKMKNKKSARRG